MLEVRYTAVSGSFSISEMRKTKFKAGVWTKVDKRLVEKYGLLDRILPSGRKALELREDIEMVNPVDAQLASLEAKEQKQILADEKQKAENQKRLDQEKAQHAPQLKKIAKAKKNADAKKEKKQADAEEASNKLTPLQKAEAESTYDIHGPLKGTPAWEYYTSGEKGLVTRRRNHAKKQTGMDAETWVGKKQAVNTPVATPTVKTATSTPEQAKKPIEGPTLADSL